MSGRVVFAAAIVPLGLLAIAPRTEGGPPGPEPTGLQRDCDSGQAAACGTLGDLYVRGRGVKRDLQRAQALLEQGCDGGHLESCRNLGVLLERTPGITPDPARARALFQKACDGGNAAGCGNLAVQYESEDPDRGLALYIKGCEMGNVLACSNGGQFLLRANDRARALGLLEKGCALGGEPSTDPLAWIADNMASMTCSTLARELEKSPPSTSAAGTPAVPASATPAHLRQRALTLLQSACQASGWACPQLAALYERGDGVPQDTTQAAALWTRYAAEVQQSCDEGLHWVCGELASLYAQGKGVPQDPQRAQDLRAKIAAATRELCDGGHDTDSCVSLARMYENGEGVTRNATQALAYFARACQAKHDMACNEERRLRGALPTQPAQ